MGLFQLNEDIHDVVNANAGAKYAIRHHFNDNKKVIPNLNRSDGGYSAAKKRYDSMRNASASGADPFKKRNEMNDIKNMMKVGHLGYYDHYASCKEEAELNVVSTSPAVKKFLNINNNSSDLNAVKPNQEYNDSYDKFFVADGDDPKTSKFNIPAALAAKTAGGDPHSDTFNNGVNKVKSSDVFKLKPVKDETEETSFKA